MKRNSLNSLLWKWLHVRDSVEGKWPPLLPIDSKDRYRRHHFIVSLCGTVTLLRMDIHASSQSRHLNKAHRLMRLRLRINSCIVSLLLCAGSAASHKLTVTTLLTSLQPWTLTWACARPPRCWTSSTRSDGSSLSRPRRPPITTTASRWPIYRWVSVVWSGGWSKQGGAEDGSDQTRRLASDADVHFDRSRLWIQKFSLSVRNH